MLLDMAATPIEDMAATMIKGMAAATIAEAAATSASRTADFIVRRVNVGAGAETATVASPRVVHGTMVDVDVSASADPGDPHVMVYKANDQQPCL